MGGRIEGLSCLFIAAVLMATNGLWFKPLSAHLPTFEIVGLRFAFTFLTVAILARLSGNRIASRNPGLEILMGLTGGVLILLYFESIDSLGMSLAVILLYTAPFFGTILSATILGEKYSRRHAYGLIASFAGLVLIIKPGFSMRLEVLPGIAAGFFYGVKMVFNRKLGETDSTWTMTFFYMLVPAIGFAVLSIINPSSLVMPTSSDILPLAGLVLIASVAGLLLQHHGAAHVPVAEGAVVLMFEAVAAVFIGVILFSEGMDAQTVLGGFLVVVSGAYLAISSRIDCESEGPGH